MRVLVTGGSGFIGSYVVEGLVGRGMTPVLFDRVRRAHPVGSEVHLGDVTDWPSVTESVDHVDGVIHLAGILGTQETVNDPLPSVEINIIGTLNVLQACRLRRRPMVFISVGNHWMQNAYSISKSAAERFCIMYAREHQTPVTIVRALNAYGPRQKVGPVRKILPTFIMAALSGKPIPVYGDGLQAMDMIHVRDVSDILIRALLHPLPGQVVEAGSGIPLPVTAIAQTVIKAVGEGAIEYLPMRPGEPDHAVVVGDPQTLRPLFNGTVPTFIPLEAGVAETVAYYRALA